MHLKDILLNGNISKHIHSIPKQSKQHSKRENAPKRQHSKTQNSKTTTIQNIAFQNREL